MASTTDQKALPPEPEPEAIQLWKRGKSGYVLLTEEDKLALSNPSGPVQLAPSDKPGEFVTPDGEILERGYPESVAADFVGMLGDMPTVVNDKQINDRGGKLMFKYPSIGIITETARKCAKANGFAILFPGGYKWKPEERVVEMSISVMHRSGMVIPMGSSRMPCLGADSKALACAVSFLRKYLLGCAFNMSWNDDSDDEVVRTTQQQAQQQNQAPTQEQWQPPKESQRTTVQQPKPEPEAIEYPHHPSRKSEYAGLLDSTSKALKTMKALECPAVRALAIATGWRPSNGKFPKNPSPSICRAVIDMAASIQFAFAEKAFPADYDHAAYELEVKGTTNGEVQDMMAWLRGQRTTIGIDLDKEYRKVRKPREDGVPHAAADAIERVNDAFEQAVDQALGNITKPTQSPSPAASPNVKEDPVGPPPGWGSDDDIPF